MTTLPELQQFFTNMEPLVINADGAHQNLIQTFVKAKQMVFDPLYVASATPDSINQFVAAQAALWAAAGQQAIGGYTTLGIIQPK